MAINVEKTLAYYEINDFSDACNCSYCNFFRDHIKDGFPGLHTYFQSLGIDSRKFFDLGLPYLDEENLVYPFVQYIVFTRGDREFGEVFMAMEIFSTESHPCTDIKEDHIVIEFGPIKFPKNLVDLDLIRDLEED